MNYFFYKFINLRFSRKSAGVELGVVFAPFTEFRYVHSGHVPAPSAASDSVLDEKVKTFQVIIVSFSFYHNNTFGYLPHRVILERAHVCSAADFCDHLNGALLQLTQLVSCMG